MRIVTWSAAIAAAVVGIALLACSEPTGSATAVAAGPAEYVGAAACARCHEIEHDAWRGSHHDLAMQVANEDTVLGDFDDATFEHHGVESRFYRVGDAFYVRTEGPDGELHDYEVKYTFGFSPLQQYLIEFPGGRLQALSVCWDARSAAEGGQRYYHLYPDEQIPHDDLLHWTGINQNWNSMCAECHSTNLRKLYDEKSDSYKTVWSEINVACEACHGPGSQHVEIADAVESGEATWGEAGSGLIVDLSGERGVAWSFAQDAVTAHRTPERAAHVEVETCAPCHSRRTVVDDAPIPGTPFLDHYRPALLEELLYHPDGQINDEVYVWGSFVQSKMYHSGVTCTDCHDAHTAATIATGNALCVRCHVPSEFDVPAHHHHPEGPGTACVDCHMPPKTYMGVDPRRDHSLRVPRPDLTAQLGTPNACNSCHDDESAQWAAAHVAEWFGPERAPHYGRALHAGRAGAPGAGAMLADVLSAAYPGIARGTAAMLLPRAPDAPGMERLQQALGDPDPLVRVGALEALESAPGRARLVALPLLSDERRIVRMAAARVLLPAASQLLETQVGEVFQQALDEHVAFQRVNADRPWAHVNLGYYHLQRGRPDAAEAEYLTALRIAPWSVEASANLADLYRSQERDADGEKVLRSALAAVPESAELHHSLGLLLIRQRRLSDSLSELEQAAKLRPENPRFSYVYAIALQETGSDRAIEVLEAAHQRHPGDQQLLVALATLHRDRGDRAAAIRYAVKLVAISSDPAAQKLLQELQK